MRLLGRLDRLAERLGESDELRAVSEALDGFVAPGSDRSDEMRL